MGRRNKNKSQQSVLASSYNPESGVYTVASSDRSFHATPVMSLLQANGQSITTGGSRSARKDHERSIKFSLKPKQAYNDRFVKVLHRLRNKMKAKDPDYVPGKLLLSGNQHDSFAIAHEALREWYDSTGRVGEVENRLYESARKRSNSI